MAHSILAAGPSSPRGSSTGEQRMDKELSDSRSAVETVCQLSRSELSPGLTWFTRLSAHRRPWPSKPSQRKLSTFDAEKGRLDGLCLTDSAEEQLKDEKLSDFGSLSQTASEMNQPDVSVRQRQWTYKLPKTPSLKRLITDDSVSEHGSTSFLYPPSPRRISYQRFQMWPPATVEHYSSGNSLPPYSVYQGPSDSFTRRLVDNPSSLSPTTSAKNKTFTGADQSPNIPFINSSEEFTSDVTADSSLSKEAFNIASGHLLYQPPLGTLTETRAIKRNVFAAGGTPGFKQHDARDMDLNATAGPSTLHLSTSPSEDDVFEGLDLDHVFPFPCIDQNSSVSSEGSRAQDIYEVLSEQSEAELQLDVGGPLSLVNCSRTNTLPVHPRLQMFSLDPRWSRRDSSCLPRSRSMPSLSQIISTKICTGASSLPDILSKSNFNEYTPDITDDENDETFRFQCSGPGLYQCSVTGLVFHMEGEGVVVYRTVPWNRRLLALHHKRPAGPLFDISCVQQSVCRLHLPHCEIRSTGGGGFLSVAHVTDEGIEFISPHEITETHVIINITGFSGFGNVKDENSPAVTVRALVLLFYQPPTDPDPTSLLNVLLLPRNVVLRDVLRVRKKLVGDEVYIETSPHCKLQPNQDYTLSTCPEDDSILVQPTEAEFDCDNYDNYFPSFQVNWETMMKHIKLFLRDTNSSHIVWERRVCLSSARGQRISLNLPPPERLLDIRSSFIDSISGPVLKSLLDKLFHSKVIADPERESAHEMQNNTDKARFVIDTVRKKGEDACSKMIEFLCEADPFLCEHLGLI